MKQTFRMGPGKHQQIFLFTGAIFIFSTLSGCSPYPGVVDYKPLPGDDWDVSTPGDHGLDPKIGSWRAIRPSGGRLCGIFLEKFRMSGSGNAREFSPKAGVPGCCPVRMKPIPGAEDSIHPNGPPPPIPCSC